MIYRRQIDSHLRSTNVLQRSAFHVFHLCPLSLKVPEMIPLVNVFPGNACSYINSLTYSDWTNCSEVFKESSFFKVIYASYPSIFLTPRSVFFKCLKGFSFCLRQSLKIRGCEDGL